MKQADGQDEQEKVKRREDSEKIETPDIDDSEPVDIETLLIPSEAQGVPEMPPDERPEKHSPEQETSPSMTSPSVGLKESDWDAKSESAESLKGPSFSLDRVLEKRDIQDPLDKDETTPETDSSCREDRRTGTSTSRINDDRETSPPTRKTAAPTDNSQTSDIPQDLVNKDLIDTLEAQLKEVKSKRLDS